MSIKLKFTFFIFSVLILVVSVISLSIFFTQRDLLKEQFEHNREKVFKDFCYSCKEALVVKDEILVLNTLRSLVETHKPQIVYAGYISQSDVKLFSARDKEKESEFTRRIFQASKSAVEIFTSADNEEIYEFSQLFENNDLPLGTLKIGFSQSYLNSQIEQATLAVARKIIKIFIFALGISLALAYILALYLVHPIKKLSNAAVELGSGNLDVRVKVERNDEVGQLAKTFDEMAERLKQLDEMKDSFVSSVSHELRSPLSAVDGYVDYLNDGLEKLPLEKQKKALSIIKDSVNRLTTFVNNILDLAKIKAGKFELHKMPTRAEDLISEIGSLFEQAIIKQQKTIEVKIQENLPMISADQEKIKQVIINLLGNAIKFTDVGAKMTIGAKLVNEKILNNYRLKKEDRELMKNVVGNFVEFTVSDTGYGMPENELDKIFDKFYQVGGSTPNKPKGTGLGLSIASDIVKLHGGVIGVESEFGKGSTFKFIIPAMKDSG